MKIPIVGGAYLDRSCTIAAQVCQNLYPIINAEQQVTALVNTPGLSLFSVLGEGEVRGFCIMGVYLYATKGNTVYRVDMNGIPVAMTGNLLTSTGKVWMEPNGTQIMIVDGQHGYILAGTTVTEIADTDFPIPGSLAYQDGYFIVNKTGTREFYLSDLLDGTGWDALLYGTKEAYPDELVAVASCQRDLWLLGKESYEVWYNSGFNDLPFSRVEGGVSRVGICAPASVASYENTLAWIDNNRQVRATQGYQAIRISTDALDYQLGQYNTVSDARGFIYAQEGHVFYVLTFPSEQKTWAYDFVTKLWHSRASGPTDARHPANCHINFNGMNLIGHYSDGNIYKYDLGTYTDAGQVLRKQRAAKAVSNEKKNVFHHSFELELEAGVGLVVDDPSVGSGSDPQVMLDWSDDDGRTWSNEHWASMGKIGENKKRAVWHKLGSSRNRVYRVTISEPVKVTITGANLEATPGAY